jgi:ABC-2 type transport system ATP-binding protein
MRILTCFTPPTRGTARVAGYDILREPDDVRREIGYLPESNPLYNEMSVCGYVEFLARLKGLSGARRRGAVDTALEETGLAQVRRRLIGNLSKGFRQRVGLAGALVGDPRVLILDEPTVGLDPAQIREIREMIRAMRGKRTVLLSTHILPEVSMTCTRSPSSTKAGLRRAASRRIW